MRDFLVNKMIRLLRVEVLNKYRGMILPDRSSSQRLAIWLTAAAVMMNNNSGDQTIISDLNIISRVQRFPLL